MKPHAVSLFHITCIDYNLSIFTKHIISSQDFNKSYLIVFRMLFKFRAGSFKFPSVIFPNAARPSECLQFNPLNKQSQP